jgi:hypothetical protein
MYESWAAISSGECMWPASILSPCFQQSRSDGRADTTLSTALQISGAGLPLPKGAAASQRAVKNVPKRAKAN